MCRVHAGGGGACLDMLKHSPMPSRVACSISCCSTRATSVAYEHHMCTCTESFDARGGVLTSVSQATQLWWRGVAANLDEAHPIRDDIRSHTPCLTICDPEVAVGDPTY